MKPDSGKQEQLNQTPEEETYSLEDIMREFGGWSKQPKEKPAAEAETADEVQTTPEEPETHQTPEVPEESEESETASEPPEEPKAEKPHFVIIDQTEQISAPPKQAEKVWTYEEPAAPDTPKIQAVVQPEQKPKKQKRPPRVKRPAAEKPQRSPEEAMRGYATAAGAAKLRLLLLLLLFLAGTGVSLMERFSALAIPGLSAYAMRFWLLAALTAVSALVAIDVLLRGGKAVARREFLLETYLLLMLLVCCGESIGAYRTERMPLFVLVQLALLVAVWSEQNRQIGCYRTLKTVTGRKTAGRRISAAANAWENKTCIYYREKTDQFLPSCLDETDSGTKIMQGYAAVVVLVTLLFAVLTHFMAGRSLMWSWAIMLCGAFPLAALYCYARPFAVLSRRMQHSGAAFYGWPGAKALSGEAGLVIQDTDLFPQGSISLNGLKVYHDFRVDQMVSYAATAVVASGSGLSVLFDTLLQEQGGHLMPIENFRTYEGGGVGAEIHGDVVLVGSLSFMHLMGIHLPEGTNIKQAVYVSVNSVLAGVVAINYNPAVSVGGALQALVRSQNLDPIFALRDFVITPVMVHHKFKVPAERLEFPNMNTRTTLTELGAQSREMDTDGAFLMRDSFAAYVDAVLGARNLVSVVRVGTVVNLICGILGLALMAFLAWSGAVIVATATNLLLFALIWMIPSFLVTTWAGRY